MLISKFDMPLGNKYSVCNDTRTG